MNAQRFKGCMNACCVYLSSPQCPPDVRMSRPFARVGRYMPYGVCVHLHLEFCLSHPFTAACLKALEKWLAYNWSANIFYNWTLAEVFRKIEERQLFSFAMGMTSSLVLKFLLVTSKICSYTTSRFTGHPYSSECILLQGRNEVWTISFFLS